MEEVEKPIKKEIKEISVGVCKVKRTGEGDIPLSDRDFAFIAAINNLAEQIKGLTIAMRLGR